MPDFTDERVRALLRAKDVERLAVFGSFARGEETEESDIDLLAYFGKPKSLFNMIDLQDGLEAVLGRKVDLLTEPALSPFIRDRVLSQARVVYDGPRVA